MVHTRVNVYAGDEWADPVLWYAKGVAAMQARALADSTAWRFWGAMHGYDAPLWKTLGYLHSHETKPPSATVNEFWKQCQHGSWYFLPWHRGYLLAFEKMVRAAVVAQGGPSTWALPYWNPFATGESKLPPAFASASWPGSGPNPLFVQARYGPRSDGNVHVPIRQVNLNALQDARFTGVSSGGSPGFGGVDTGFSHGGQVHGDLESQPHDMIHVFVGGGDPSDPSLPGLMSDPDTAGLDPIFWLHHANIDRLWESWNHSGHTNPTNPAWLGGPGASGGRPFAMPNPDGTTWNYTPADVLSIHALGYKYDSLSPTAGGSAAAVSTPAEGAAPVAANTAPELVGATTGSVSITGEGVASQLRLDPAAHQQTIQALAARAPAAADQAPGQGAGERVFLNLENIRGTAPGAAFEVYVGLGDDADPTAHSDLLAGTVAPFGVRKASLADGEHAGQGLTIVLDVTDVLTRLHVAGSFAAGQLAVRLVPIGPVPHGAELTVGRISLYRHAA